MNFLNYFFRGQPDGYVYEFFSFSHILILIVAILGTSLIIIFKDFIKENRKISLIIKYGIILTLLMQQIVLYLWYLFSGYNILEEGLPLYNSRIAIIATALGLLLGNNSFKTLACYWGIFSSVLALIYPGVDPFSFPHYTEISYFIGHIVLAWGVAYIFAIEGFKYTKLNLKQILIFTNVYHLIVLIFNMILGSNYCYLNRTPIGLGKDWPEFIYVFVIMSVYNLVICISFILIKLLSSEIEDEHEDRGVKV